MSRLGNKILTKRKLFTIAWNKTLYCLTSIIPVQCNNRCFFGQTYKLHLSNRYWIIYRIHFKSDTIGCFWRRSFAEIENVPEDVLYKGYMGDLVIHKLSRWGDIGKDQLGKKFWIETSSCLLWLSSSMACRQLSISNQWCQKNKIRALRRRLTGRVAPLFWKPSYLRRRQKICAWCPGM